MSSNDDNFGAKVAPPPRHHRAGYGGRDLATWVRLKGGADINWSEALILANEIHYWREHAVRDVLENYVPNLGTRLKEHGISKGQLARAMGVHPTQIVRWFRTPGSITLQSMLRIEAAMDRLIAEKAA